MKRIAVTSAIVLVAGFAALSPLLMSSGGAAPPAKLEAILASSAPPATVKERLARFAPAPVGVKPGKLNPKHLRLVEKLVEAADHLDRVFWRQVSEGGLETYETLAAAEGERAAELAGLMAVNYGPWDRLVRNEAFIGTRPKPAGGALYPADISRRELQGFMDDHPEAVADLMSPYTVVRRKGAGLVAIAYSEKYRSDLKKAAGALREAAAFSNWDSLKDFLLTRADSFSSGDYYGSELKWMETDDCPFIVVMGPYEFYEDLLMGNKAAFEAIIALRDDKQTMRFKGLAEQIPAILAALPLDAGLKERLVPVKQQPITVADELYAAGDTRAGAQTTAFTLPNDPRVRSLKGTRQVILRNVARAKFNHSWLPLSRLVVAEDQVVEISFDSYFDQLIGVELARGITTGQVKYPDGSTGGARQGLRQRYHAIEEAKSDALGLFIAFYLMEHGFLGERTELSAAATYIASVFRVIRFDSGGAHGVAKAIVFNYLARRGAFVYDPTTRRYRADMEKLKPAVTDIMGELFGILATADYDRAGQLIMEFGLLSDDVREKLADLRDVPVDIKPEYSIKKAFEKR